MVSVVSSLRGCAPNCLPIHDVSAVWCFISHRPCLLLANLTFTAPPIMPRTQQTANPSRLSKKDLEKLLRTREAECHELSKKLGKCPCLKCRPTSHHKFQNTPARGASACKRHSTLTGVPTTPRIVFPILRVKSLAEVAASWLTTSVKTKRLTMLLLYALFTLTHHNMCTI